MCVHARRAAVKARDCVLAALYQTLRRAKRAPSHKRLCCARAAPDVMTTVMESACYGKCTSTSAGGGIIMVKTRRVLVLAAYSDPVTAAEAIPHVHRCAEDVARSAGE